MNLDLSDWHRGRASLDAYLRLSGETYFSLRWMGREFEVIQHLAGWWLEYVLEKRGLPQQTPRSDVAHAHITYLQQYLGLELLGGAVDGEKRIQTNNTLVWVNLTPKDLLLCWSYKRQSEEQS